MKKRFYLSTLIPMGAVLCFVLCGTLILNAGYGFLWVPANFGVYPHELFSFHTILCMAMFMAALFFSFNYFWYADNRRLAKTIAHGVSLILSIGGLISMTFLLLGAIDSPQLRPDFEKGKLLMLGFFYYLPAGLAKIGILLSSVVLLFTLDPYE